MPLISKPGPSFSLGRIYRVPSGTTPTPRQYGLVKAFSAELTYETKSLPTENIFDEYIVKSGAKLTGKIQIAEDSNEDLLSIAQGATSTSSARLLAYKEAGTIPASVSYTVTVTHAADFHTNLGVQGVVSGKFFQRVASTPATGEYSVDEATGVYTFAAADASLAVLITYEYHSATGTTTTISQGIAELTTSYDSIFAYRETLGVKKGLWLPRVVISKYPFGLALKEFASFEYDFQAYPDPVTGKVIEAWEV